MLFRISNAFEPFVSTKGIGFDSSGIGSVHGVVPDALVPALY